MPGQQKIDIPRSGLLQVLHLRRLGERRHCLPVPDFAEAPPRPHTEPAGSPSDAARPRTDNSPPGVDFDHQIRLPRLQPLPPILVGLLDDLEARRESALRDLPATRFRRTADFGPWTSDLGRPTSTTSTAICFLRHRPETRSPATSSSAREIHRPRRRPPARGRNSAAARASVARSANSYGLPFSPSRKCRPVSETNTSSSVACRVVRFASATPRDVAAARAAPAAPHAAARRPGYTPRASQRAERTDGNVPSSCSSKVGDPIRQ